MTKMHPHEARVRARQRSYPNSQVEKESIARIDDAVFARVRQIEQRAAENARGFIAHNERTRTEADDVTQEVKRLRWALQEGQARGDSETGAAYVKLRRSALALASRLEREEREAEWLATRADQPYESYVSLMTKYASVLTPDLPF